MSCSKHQHKQYVYNIVVWCDIVWWYFVITAVIIRFAETQYSVVEGESTDLQVERVGATAYPISVNLRTIDGSATGVHMMRIYLHTHVLGMRGSVCIHASHSQTVFHCLLTNLNPKRVPNITEIQA